MRKAILLSMLCAVYSPAESNFNAPLVAVARDEVRQLRLVYGVTGNFILRGTIATNVSSWAFSGTGGLVQTQSALLVVNMYGGIARSIESQEGAMVLAPGTASLPALSFSPADSQLRQMRAQMDEQTDEKVALDPDALAGNVVALRAVSRSRAELAVCRNGDLWRLTVKLSSGSVEHESMAGGTAGKAACGSANAAAVLLMGGRIIVARSGGLIIQDADGMSRTIDLARAGPSQSTFQIRQAGDGWIALDSEKSPPTLVRLTGTGEGIYRLPSAELKQ